MDQAETLRRLMKDREQTPTGSSRAKIITIASGKGGVGKSVLTSNLGYLLARSGLKVLLIDADPGLANLDVLFGRRVRVGIDEVAAGAVSAKSALIPLAERLHLLPGSSGIKDRAINDDGSGKFAPVLRKLLVESAWDGDVVLVDLPAGISQAVVEFHNSADASLLVMTPEPTSFTDAYGLVKIVRREAGVSRFGAIVNFVTCVSEAQALCKKLNQVAERFVDAKVEFLGHCPRDMNVTDSVMKRRILVESNSGASAVRALELVAKRIRESILGLVDEPVLAVPGNNAGLWKALLGEVKQ